jgi:hypothetical protein
MMSLSEAPPSIKRTAWRWNLVVVALGVPLFVPLFWWTFDRTPPYTFEQVAISPSYPRPGEDIYITFDVKHRRAPCNPGVIYREFREATGKIHVYDPVQRARPPIGDRFTRMATIPPAGIAYGPTTYRASACYTCNPLQRWLRWPVCVHTPDVMFTIAPPREP